MLNFGASMFSPTTAWRRANSARVGRARLRVGLVTGTFAYSGFAQDAVSRGGDLPKKYYDAMDPFVTLTMAAGATKTLKVGTGVCLVAQRDPIQTAKLVASIDKVSGGRFLFGIGNGWNQDEMEDHGTAFKDRHKMARESVEAMKAIWTQSKAVYHGEFVKFDPMMT